MPTSSATVIAGRRNIDSHASQIARSSVVGGKWLMRYPSLFCADDNRKAGIRQCPACRKMSQPRPAAGVQRARRGTIVTNDRIELESTPMATAAIPQTADVEESAREVETTIRFVDPGDFVTRRYVRAGAEINT